VKNIAVFASGRGSNFKKIYQKIQEGKLPARISCLITDNERAGALAFARENDVPGYIIRPGDFVYPHQFGEKLLQILSTHQTDWIVLAGYLKKIPDNVVAAYSNRILNIHPALLPSFGGKGMYGIRVHQAVFDSGARVSGVTIHLVNTEYDAGPIVAQQAVYIEDCDTPEEIAERVLQIEHELYWKTLRKVLSDKFNVQGKRVVFY